MRRVYVHITTTKSAIYRCQLPLLTTTIVYRYYRSLRLFLKTTKWPRINYSWHDLARRGTYNRFNSYVFFSLSLFHVPCVTFSLTVISPLVPQPQNHPLLQFVCSHHLTIFFIVRFVVSFVQLICSSLSLCCYCSLQRRYVKDVCRGASRMHWLKGVATCDPFSPIQKKPIIEGKARRSLLSVIIGPLPYNFNYWIDECKSLHVFAKQAPNLNVCSLRGLIL